MEIVSTILADTDEYLSICCRARLSSRAARCLGSFVAASEAGASSCKTARNPRSWAGSGAGSTSGTGTSITTGRFPDTLGGEAQAQAATARRVTANVNLERVVMLLRKHRFCQR